MRRKLKRSGRKWLSNRDRQECTLDTKDEYVTKRCSSVKLLPLTSLKMIMAMHGSGWGGHQASPCKSWPCVEGVDGSLCC